MAGPSPSDGTDLEALIQKAHHETLRAERGPQVPPPRRALAGRLWGALLLAVAAFALHALWSAFAPPSTSQTARDLEAAVDAARKSVEAERSRTGRLPDALPNAALASVVRYEPEVSTYKLSATILGVRVTLETDGRKTTETGVNR